MQAEARFMPIIFDTCWIAQAFEISEKVGLIWFSIVIHKMFEGKPIMNDQCCKFEW